MAAERERAELETIKIIETIRNSSNREILSIAMLSYIKGFQDGEKNKIDQSKCAVNKYSEGYF